MYGDSESKIPENILSEMNEVSENLTEQLLFIWHPDPGKEIEILNETIGEQ